MIEYIAVILLATLIILLSGGAGIKEASE